MGERMEDPWTRYVIDQAATGGPHDIIFVDVDNDGKKEMIAIANYFPEPCIYIYKPGLAIPQNLEAVYP
jgi:hypothetical protein